MKMYILLFILLITLNCDSIDSVIAKQIIENPSSGILITKVTDLANQLNENSGLINFNGKLITHNDSGGDPNLYEINIANGMVDRTVVIINAQNIDMEDVAQDDKYIYLCDIGNNSNQRKDQTIYKIDKSEYLKSNSVSAELITISYNKQSDYSKTNRNTNFDAEAVVAIGNKLFLFTKNWGNFETSVYEIPKNAGDYVLTEIDSYNIGGLITGADYNKGDKTLILTGYKDFGAFIVILTDFSENNPLDGKIDKKSIFVAGSIQIEGIAANPDGSYFLSAEESAGLPASLYSLTFN